LFQEGRQASRKSLNTISLSDIPAQYSLEMSLENYTAKLISLVKELQCFQK